MSSEEAADVKPDVKPDVVAGQLNVKVAAQDGTEVHFKIKGTTVMKKVFDSYCQRQGIADSKAVRFLDPEGERINPEFSAEKVGLEDGDTIDVFFEQVGGCM